jgi:hypothetical protein
MGVLTDADKQILPMALRQNGGFNVATKWYCMGWDPLWYQYLFHQAPVPGGTSDLTVPNVSALMGIAAGKTTVVAASYLMDCLTMSYFKALNTSVTAKQSELPFSMVQGWIEGNPRLEHLVDDVSLRPYPTIIFKNGSVWVFRTAGKDARFIRGMEFDRINYDEAGLDFSGEAIKVLRGRLRGRRIDGSIRMGRLDTTTSPTAAPWLEDRFEKGWAKSEHFDPQNFLSIRVSTFMNTMLTKQQIDLMVAEYSDDMIDVELRAKFPDYGLSIFPRTHVHACTDQSLNDAVEMALNPEDGSKPKAGYVMEEHPRYGITKFELPLDPSHQYVIAGDPGTDGPPHRNAGVVMAMDVTCRPRKVVYFHWVDGKGSYNPFLTSYKYAMKKYRPLLKGMDTTGTQKAIDELAFENMGMEIDGINFQRDKEAMLNSLILMVTNHEIVWPTISAIIKQMTSYNRENEKKLAQDVVMTVAQLAFLERFIPDYEASAKENAAKNSNIRHVRTSTGRRRR